MMWDSNFELSGLLHGTFQRYVLQKRREGESREVSLRAQLIRLRVAQRRAQAALAAI